MHVAFRLLSLEDYVPVPTMGKMTHNFFTVIYVIIVLVALRVGVIALFL